MNAEARVKRWCKRPPASPETGAARQAPPGATPIGAMTRPAELQVGGNEPAGGGGPRCMAAPDRIPLTDRLQESPALQGFPIQSGFSCDDASVSAPDQIAVNFARLEAAGAEHISGPGE